jgi:hypothetical protein
MREGHEKMRGMPARMRPNYLKINIDIAKAFDSMARDKII